ncbi:MAG: major facilitator superfamily 1 [Chloroflexi bacterium]|nr:major facilitator superfamily 1 [Chloroflexota bacterium]
MIPPEPPEIIDAELAVASAPSESGGASALSVFGSRPFLLLWLSQVFTQVGGNMVLYGLTVLVYSLTYSNSAVSLLLLTFLVPAVIFSPFAGVYVDRFDRRRVLVVTNLARAGLFAVMVFVDTNVAIIYLINIAVSTASTFFAPAELAMIPLVVSRKQLLTATGVFTLTLNTAFAVGFTILGPLVVKVAGPSILIAVVAGCYLIATLFCWTLPAAPPTPVTRPDTLHEAEAAVDTFRGQFREGVAYVASHRSVAWALTYLVIASSVVGVLGALGPGFATTVLGLAPDDFVVVVLPLGAGLVLGVLLLTSVERLVARRRIIEGGLVSLGALLLLLTIAGPITSFIVRLDQAQTFVDVSSLVSILSIVIAIGFLAGMAYAFVAIPAQTELQEEIDENVRGRVFGILNMLISIGSLLPIIVVGTIADIVGLMPVVIALALIIFATGLASIFGRDRRRRPRRGTSAEPEPAAAASAPIDGSPVSSLEAEPAADQGAGLQAGLAGPSPDEP